MRLEFDVFENNGALKSAYTPEGLLGKALCSHASRAAPKLDQYFTYWFLPLFLQFSQKHYARMFWRK